MIRKILVGILVLAILSPMMAGPNLTEAQPADSPWPMYGHDPQHTGRSTYQGPDTALLKGRAHFSEYLGWTAVSPDGTLYIQGINKLFAWKDGYGVLWSFSTEDLPTQPVVGHDGTIYFGGSATRTGRYLYALDPQGREKWRVETGAVASEGITIGQTGNLYVPLYDSLLCLDPLGNQLWECSEDCQSAPVVAADGTIYITGEDRLCAIEPNGLKKWQFQAGDDLFNLSLAANGSIYVGSGDHFLYAVDPSGHLQWKFPTSGNIYDAPAIGPDGTIYASSADYRLYAVNPDGTQKWSFVTGSNHPRPLVDANGVIYLGARDSLSALNAAGALLWTYTYAFARGGYRPILMADGLLYWLTETDQNSHDLHVLQSLPQRALPGPTGHLTPMIFLKQPVGGELIRGKTYEIQWNFMPGTPSEGSGSVSIYLSCDSGGSWSLIDTVDAADQSYTWNLPIGQCASCRIKLIWISLGPPAQLVNDNASAGDFSFTRLLNAPTAIPGGGLLRPTIELAQPTEGEILRVGQIYPVKWSTHLEPSDPNQVRVLFSSDGGTTWDTIHAGANAGFFGWTVPDFPSESSQIKLEWLITGPPVQPIAQSQTVGFVIQGPTPTASPTPSLSFPDVPADYWAYTEIMSLVEAGVVNGYPDGTFKPEFPVTRAEFAKMALLSLGYALEFPETPSFPDLVKEEWYYGYVEGAVKHGLVKGYPDGTFQPQGNITMAEILTVVVRAKGWEEAAPPGPPPFILLHDRDDSVRAITAEDWYYGTVGAAAQHGLLLFPDHEQITTAGGSSGEYQLRFNTAATRAQTAVFLARMRGMP